MKKKKQPATKGKTKKENRSLLSKIIRYALLILLCLFLLALFVLVIFMQHINLKHK